MDLLARRRKICEKMDDKSQWPKVNLGIKLLPPLTKRDIGRQRKNRIIGCLEKEGGKSRTKGRVMSNKKDH
ncbi:hypothetical protein E2562_003394 [Oryza meyeriana var. granulata]|uniref:Uncharacterized protein n=1 Tax=Oryza meyeriana var. granulata TaxID=110450 RepID=A0A6G1EGU8_9ORYZ|nr:hypothetical protein E2562_003394 [Oryza meyeriana var. granulata]